MVTAAAIPTVLQGPDNRAPLVHISGTQYPGMLSLAQHYVNYLLPLLEFGIAICSLIGTTRPTRYVSPGHTYSRYAHPACPSCVRGAQPSQMQYIILCLRSTVASWTSTSFTMRGSRSTLRKADKSGDECIIAAARGGSRPVCLIWNGGSPIWLRSICSSCRQPYAEPPILTVYARDRRPNVADASSTTSTAREGPRSPRTTASLPCLQAHRTIDSAAAISYVVQQAMR